jgi:hypothetical protein
MTNRPPWRDGVWTGVTITLAALGLQAALSCGPAGSRDFVEAPPLDAGPIGGRPPTPDADYGGTGGTGGNGGNVGLSDGPQAGAGGTGGSAMADAPAEAPGTPDAPSEDGPPGDLPATESGSISGDVGPPDPTDGAPATDAPALNLNQGLVSRWKLDEPNGNSTADSATGMNTGTLNGPARVQEGFPGAKYANPASLRFDGDNDFVSVGTRNLPANNRAQSVTFWFNIAAMPTNSQLGVSLTDGVPSGGSRLKLGFLGGQMAAWKGGNDPLATGPAVQPGWHHFAYTFTGTVHRLYIDGAQTGTSMAAPDTGAVTNARLGGGFDNSENFLGQLDEVRIYNRALAAEEVAALSDGLE